MTIRISQEKNTIEAAVLGGCFLGGGGGGSKEEGLALARLAFEVGRPKLLAIDSLPNEAQVVTVGLVGSPASAGAYVKPMHYVRAAELLTENLKSKCEIAGFITNENGGVATVNGWFQSAVTGLPVIDAPCNGRAHPTGQMGSMNLDQLDNYVSVQAFAGGGGALSYLEGMVKGGLGEAASLVRKAAVAAGGLVAVARNPVDVSYVKNNGAPGAITQAIRIGQIILEHTSAGGIQVAEACCEFLGGKILSVGCVKELQLQSKGGFDHGHLLVEDGPELLHLTFWNEYMTAIRGVNTAQESRLGTFPDLITTLDYATGVPLTTAEIKERQNVIVLVVPKGQLKLGATMAREDLIKNVEDIVGQPMVEHVFQYGR